MKDVCRGGLTRFLRRLSLRSRLSTKEREAILSLSGTVVTLRARRDLVVPGERVDYACLVERGVVGRFDQMADGRRQTTALYIAGDMCDLHSVPLPIAAWGLSAQSNATIVQLPHAKLRELVAEYPAIAMAFWRDTSADGAILSKAVANLGRSDARRRLAHIFCELGYRMGVADLGTRTDYDLPITQEQLGDFAGLTAIHINRVLRELREKKLVAHRGGHIQVFDFAALQKVAEFDPAYLAMDPSRE